MKKTTMLIIGMLICIPYISLFGQHTIWHSPLNFSTGTNNLTITPSIPSTTIRVTTSSVGDLQWIQLGLIIPSNVCIDSVNLCYELSSSSSFISQVRLTKTTTPDVAYVIHDDPTDLNDTVPTCYSSPVGGIVPTGTITLALRLNYSSTSDWIDIGGIGIVVSPITISIQPPQISDEISDELLLRQNYPNPFNPNTTIEYQLKKAGYVELKIYNVKGQLVDTLVKDKQNTGNYSVIWDAKGISSGMYFYQISVDGQPTDVKKAICVK